MATAAIPNAGVHSLSTTTTVDASLWWDPFSSLLTELESSTLSSQSLAKKLKDNHAWFLGTISQFKQPNRRSREALDSLTVKIGSHELNIHPKLKDISCKFSAIMCLDEVQSYIVVTRSAERNNLDVGDMDYDILNPVILEYYTERQCLLKCIRQIFMHALYTGSQSGESAVMEEAQMLISDELESKLLSNLLDLVSSNCIEHMDVDLYTLWAEETLIEDNLILDILFLAYNESFRVCDAKSWKKLCVLYEDIVTGLCNFQKLAISPEATGAIYHAKVQLLLILIKALNLDSLLQMIHDNIPFRQGHGAFSEIDITDMDTIISSFNAVEVKELGPLILAWAVFICLISSLPNKEETNMLAEINHIGYVRQAFEASSLGYFLEILRSDTLKDPEGPLAGYQSVMRTFISAFIASYEISLQFEDVNFKSILDILCNIYRGEELLSVQFWDRDSFIDGPIRCLLCNLEGEFPYRTVELVRLLSALCEGSWPSECVFNFLNKSVGLSTPMEINNGSEVDAVSKVVVTHFPLNVTGVEGLVIPSKTRGHVLRMIKKNVALVRWEHTESGLLVLLLRLAQELYTKNFEEVHAILDLLSRLATFNMAVCCALMDAGKSFLDDATVLRNQEKKNIRIDVVEIVCFLVKSLSPCLNSAVTMALGINMLTKMLKCLPSRVATMVLKVNLFDVDVVSNSSSSGSWLLSGRLAKMLLIDCEQIDGSLSLSVLDFTMQLLHIGLKNDTVLALIVFCIQYVFVNHESWTFKVKHTHWKVTVKVLEVMKKCIQSFSCYEKLGDIIRGILLNDSSVHTVLFRIVCRTSESLEKLYVSRFFDIVDIEGLQLSISTGLDVLVSLVSAFAKDPPSFPVFHHAILSPVTKPTLVITAATSLISYFGDPKIQIWAARLLSVLFTADFSQSLTYSNASLGLDNKQLSSFRKSMVKILCVQLPLDEDLIVVALKLLASAVLNQPAFLTAVIVNEEISNDKPQIGDSEHQLNTTENGSLGSTDESLLDSILYHVRNSEDLLKRKPNILLSLMKFLMVLWQDAARFSKILERLKLSDDFWTLLTSPLMVITCDQDKVSEKLTEEELQCQTYRYQYLSIVLDIMGHEIFLQKRLMDGELAVNRFSKSDNGTKRKEDSEIAKNRSFISLKEIISSWCESSLLSNLIKACVSSEYENKIHWHAKVAAALCIVHVMIKLKNGDSGSLSVSFIERIATLAQKLCKLPAFSNLSTLYAERGYSEGQELDYLILSDLFYHVKGELEGRHIDNRLFKELLQFLLESEFLEMYKYRNDDDILADNNGVYLYDSVRLRADLGLELWDLLAWIETKEVAETALLCWQRVNLVIMHSHSKLSALRGIISLFHLHGDNFKLENFTQIKISEELVLSCINHVCQCLHAMLASLNDVPDTDEDGLNILSAQAELLLLLTRSRSNDFSRSAFVVIVKTSGYGLKVLCSYRQSVGVVTARKVFLMLILSSVQLSFKDLHSGAVEISPEASNASLGLLPVLCDCIEYTDCCTLSLTAIDIILGSFSLPATWFPTIQKHFPVQHIVQKLRDMTSSKTVSIILKFLLNFARVREGAEMLLNSGVLESLRMLLSDCSGGVSLPVVQCGTSFSYISEKTEKPQPVWGLSLAVLASIIQSLENSSSATIVDYVLSSILVDKAPLILLYLSAPDFPFEGHEKKRARVLKSTISLHELEETQNTMTLICVLARHWNSWNKTLKNIESQLREKIIHFLAFISRATQRHGESPRSSSPLLCHPVLKEEFKWYSEPSFINSRNGWFALSALGCELNHNLSALAARTTLMVRDQSSDKANIAPQTHFSDLIAIEMYKLAFLLLKFLCIQAESASRMAEEVGFVDLAHFPELPMPDILHGLQDQGISIVTELCTASKTKPITREIQNTCSLMLQITIMALHLEYCVIQICGIRPVLGHVETFSKELQLLIRATEGHLFLKESLQDLMQIISFVYPELEASY